MRTLISHMVAIVKPEHPIINIARPTLITTGLIASSSALEALSRAMALQIGYRTRVITRTVIGAKEVLPVTRAAEVDTSITGALIITVIMPLAAVSMAVAIITMEKMVEALATTTKVAIGIIDEETIIISANKAPIMSALTRNKSILIQTTDFITKTILVSSASVSIRRMRKMVLLSSKFTCSSQKINAIIWMANPLPNWIKERKRQK